MGNDGLPRGFDTVMARYRAQLHAAIEEVWPQVPAFVEHLCGLQRADATLLVIGNGGSASNASHFAQDMANGTRASLSSSKRFRALSLVDNLSFVTALGNDDGYDRIFEQQLRVLGRPGDSVLAISVSGNSPNVLRAVEYAASHRMKVIALTGMTGGRLKDAADVLIHVPSNDMGMCEAVHSAILHFVTSAVKQWMLEASTLDRDQERPADNRMEAPSARPPRPEPLEATAE